MEASELLSLFSSVDKKKLEVWFLSLTWSCISWANLSKCLHFAAAIIFFSPWEKKGKFFSSGFIAVL